MNRNARGRAHLVGLLPKSLFLKKALNKRPAAQIRSGVCWALHQAQATLFSYRVNLAHRIRKDHPLSPGGAGD